MSKQFRLCAAAVVFNSEGKILLGNRIDSDIDAWQFPQGGIETGETPAEAAKRELFEETGISSVKVIYADETPIRYEFSEKVKQAFQQRGIFNSGQDIYFVLFYFTGSDGDINLQTSQPEFKAYKWDTLDFAEKNVISFKKNAYSYAVKQLQPIIRQYLDSVS